MKRIFLLAWAVALVIGGSAFGAPRPNILFILADDQAPWAVRVTGYTQAITPNMDRIAHEGARFTSAFTATPVCSPARTSIMTSRYGEELGIHDWINPKVDKGIGLPADVPTWPALLSKAGYATGLIGKYHLGDLPEQHPTKRGYGYFMGFIGGGNKPKDPTLEKDGVTTVHKGFIVDIVADEAIDFIRKHADKPFALSVHFREPHAPYMPQRDEDWDKFKSLDPVIPNPDYPGLDVEKCKNHTREYLTAVTAIDRNLGRILQLLDELKLAENTLVIYTSDHGYNIGHHGIWHKGNGHWMLKPEAMPEGTPNVPKGQRPNMYDTSLKVPLVVRWPGVIKPGVVIDRTVSHLDWLPTLCSIGGASVPTGTVVRGHDITPVLRGEQGTWSDDFYSPYSTKHQSQTHMRMYRTPQWKLVRDFNNEGRDELYDLAHDPEETKNLINDNSPQTKAVIAMLDAKIIENMTATHDVVLETAKKRLGR
jgi:uncharacterized sulfatase